MLTFVYFLLFKNLKFTSVNVHKFAIATITIYTIVDICYLGILFKFARLAFIESI
jgi:hypothetical protein